MTVQTPLERSAGARYSTAAEMGAFLRALCALAPGRARLDTAPGSDLPVLVCAPPRGPARLRVMLVGSLHGASEAAPGEALLALARDLLCDPQGQLGDDLEIILLPCPNPSGRDRDSARNAAGVNLNRDFVLLGEPESRALDAALRHYAPEVLLDAHESAVLKRRSLGREGWLTALGVQFDIADGPAAPAPLRALSREVLLPALLAGARARGLAAQRYVGEIRSVTQPITHGHLTLRALRNKAAAHGIAAVLLETPMEPKADPHPSFRNIIARTARQRLCMAVFLESVRRHAAAIRAAGAAARALPDEPALALGARYVREPAHATLALALVERASGARVAIEFPDHRSVREDPPLPLPSAYWITAHTEFFAEWLARHGLRHARVAAARPVEAAWEHYGEPDERGCFACLAEHRGPRTLPAGTLHVPLAGPQRRLAALLLEPRSTSSLFSHAAYAALVRPGSEFFIWRAL